MSPAFQQLHFMFGINMFCKNGSINPLLDPHLNSVYNYLLSITIQHLNHKFLLQIFYISHLGIGFAHSGKVL